jgi:hypothetical protein
MLQAQEGIAFSVAALTENSNMETPVIQMEQIISQHVASEVAEKAISVKYPAFYVYCDKVVNSLKEKFRVFSGTAEMNVEVRVSHDRIEGLESRLHLLTDAVTDVLDRNRGEWTKGMYYTGGYEVQFGAIKNGGKHFVQTAKVRFTVNMSSEQ